MPGTVLGSADRAKRILEEAKPILRPHCAYSEGGQGGRDEKVRWETNEKLCMSYTLLRKKGSLIRGRGVFLDRVALHLEDFQRRLRFKRNEGVSRTSILGQSVLNKENC